jgi:nicotinate-nucleotide adenylyltransferase
MTLSQTRKIALFGTSADPPTSGHQEIIQRLSEHYDWVGVWAADNPLKSQQTPLTHRAIMLGLLISDIDPPKQNISLEQELSSWRTIETIAKASLRWSDQVEFTLVVGADLLKQLPHWYQAADLLRKVQLLVIPRPGYTIHDSSLELIKQLGGKIAIANFMGLDVSSTAFREHKNAESLIPPIVAYIHKEHLYECQRAL